jgi:MFS family permease
VLAYFAVLGVASGVWLARIPAVKQHLGLSDGLLGLTLLAAPVGLVVAIPLANWGVHRFGSRTQAPVAGVAAALLAISLGLAPSMAALMAGLFGYGLFGGLLDVAMNAQAVQVERRYARPLMSSFHACYSFGALAGSLLGGLFALVGLGPAVNFAAVDLPLAVVALLAARWLVPDAAPEAGTASADERPADERPAGDRPAQAGKSAGGIWTMWTLPLLLLGLLAVCSLLGEGSADGWSAVYVHDNLHASAAVAALAFAAFSVAMAFGRLAGDRLAARLGSDRLMRRCGLLAAAGLVIALASGSPVGAIIGFALFGAGLSSTFPLLLSAAGNVYPARPAVGIARVAGLGYLGMMVGPVLIGGLASAFGLTAALVLPLVLALVVALGAGVVRQRAA